ncbi:MAG: LysM peptidoglycan-binding domain-containing protein [Anaerolineaceae bacterium]|nr:LysM peptidoglycan-binding domain-containing protein [Anaerolineaceae bacterium]
MSSENTSNTQICPTCGTRLSASAAKCTVCGTVLSKTASTKAVKVQHMPELTLSLPVMIGLVVLLLAIGAGTVYAVMQSMQPEPGATPLVPTSTITITPTITVTPSPTTTSTPEPTLTPLPPRSYTVAAGDTCLSIAILFDVSYQSIILENNLSADCILSPGNTLLIPQPTPTASPQPTKTLNPTEQAALSCESMDYLVTATDTLGVIAGTYGITIQSLKDFNGLPSDIIYEGQLLKIPLCDRGEKPTATPTPIPPYAAPNLLLPADGAPFTGADVITLQWASIGELRANEAYAVTLEDLTSGEGIKVVEYVTDTKFIVPDELRPPAGIPHVFRWTVLPVRQTGTDADTGNPVWEPAGPVSDLRTFSWTITAGQ